MNAEGEPVTRLQLERLLPATRERVFAWWTDPERMAKWLSPTREAKVSANVVVGGAFRVVMVGDGVEIEHTGEYLEIDPPRRLVFTWMSAYTGDGPSLVTVDLEQRGDSTRIVLTHERLPGEHVEPHRGGWGTILDNLALSLTDSREEAVSSRSARTNGSEDSGGD